MLRVFIEGSEYFDETNEEFVTFEDTVLDLEHSLLSLSKWESKHQKPFLSQKETTAEENLDYLKAMVISPNPDLDALRRCSVEVLTEIQEYINSPQSATTFGSMPERRGPGEIITAELIYYWMVAFNIPWEAETWHLNRLFSLIRICNVKNSKPQKRSRAEIAQERARINAERRAQLGTKG